MKNIPRILPLVGVAAGGVLALNALSGAKDLPSLLTGARAFAEEAAKGVSEKASLEAIIGEERDAAALPPPSITPKPVCAPTAAELARQAGLSPAELQILQSLGDRRGQLDKREDELNTQLALLAAAEAKLDAKMRALNGLKGEVQSLLTQVDTKEQAEIARLITVYQGMKARDAAPRFSQLEENVRLQIAAGMNPRALSAIMAQMAPADAKSVTEGLARRFGQAKAAAERAQQEAANQAQAQQQAQAAPAAAPARRPAANNNANRPRRAPANQQAAANPPAAATPPAAQPAAPATANPAAAAPAAKAG